MAGPLPFRMVGVGLGVGLGLCRLDKFFHLRGVELPMLSVKDNFLKNRHDAYKYYLGTCQRSYLTH